MQEMKIISRVRKLLEAIDQSSKDTDQQATLNAQLALLVALDSTAYDEIVRSGRAFESHITAALAAVIAVPTTAIMLGVYNNEPDGGRSYIVDRVWALAIVAPASVGQAALIGALGQTRVAAAVSAALAINSQNGMGGKDTKAIVATAALDAVTGVAANWRLLPGQTAVHRAIASVPGQWLNAEINGRIIVPPGREFAMHVLADTVGSTFIGGIEWHEKQVELA